MSYDYRDEIKSDIENEIEEILGGPTVTLEERDGKTYKVFRQPFDAYDKGGDMSIYFKTEEDFQKVQNEITYKSRILYCDDRYNEIRFDCT